MRPRNAAERLAVLREEGARSERLVDLARAGETVIGESTLRDGAQLEFTASNIRNDRTGIHARLRVEIAGGFIGQNVFNIERDAERVRFANSCAEQAGDKSGLSKPIKARLDEFCCELWEAWTAGDAPFLVRGRDIAAAEFLLEPYLTASKTILFAPGGSAKSWLALVWALTLHHGLDQPWKARKQTQVLYVDFEDEHQAMSSRLFQLAGLMGCPAEIPAYFAEGKGLKDVWDGLRRYIDETKPGLLIVDSISRLSLGKLIEDEAANKAVDMLNRLGVPWLALAHTPKASGEHVFGSAMYEYGARVVVKGEATQSPDDLGLIGLRLSITKANHLRLGQSQTWAFRFGEDRLVEHRPAKAGDFPDLGPMDNSLSSQVRAFLLEVGPSSATDIAAEIGADRSRVAHTLSEGRSFSRMDRRGRTVLWGVASFAESPS